MKVILLKNVPKVGKKDDVVEVASGYAQHALFPKKLGIPATPAALEALARHKQNAVAEKQVRHHLLDKAIQELQGMHIAMPAKANEQGSLFSKIDTSDIVEYLSTAHRISIDLHLVHLPQGPIKSLGSYTIHVADEGFAADFVIDIVRQ
jgi:large subunit ribosomal protein L9